jgi:alpha-galactosidase
MPELLELGGERLIVSAESARPARGGYLLRGRRASVVHPFGETRYYRHGWHSWSPTGWVAMRGSAPLVEPAERRPQADDPVAFGAALASGSGVGAIEAPGARVLLLGALGPGARVNADETAITGSTEAPTGEWFLALSDEPAAFTAYAALLAERLGPRSTRATPRVWSSWYSFYRAIGEDSLRSVLADLAGTPFEVFQIDDGWQAGIGDWDAGPNFPSGMAGLADAIRESGFEPGIWVAPLIARPGSRLAAEHPDWLLRDESGAAVTAGSNWGGVFHALDTTHPAVKEWLEALVARLVGWGYNFLKLDFLYAGALPGRRRVETPREEAYRDALRSIRRSAGDAYLLGCGAPVLASLGVVDGLRIGPDSAPYWVNEAFTVYLHDESGPGALTALKTALNRLWLAEAVQIDTDAVYFRSRFNLLTPLERQALLDLAAIARFKSTSDPPAWLDEPERAALQEWLRAAPRSERLGRYRYRIDGREVDFGWIY